MSNATVLPTYSQAKFFKWNAKLTAPLAASTSAQTVYWDEAPLDENGAIVTGGFMITCKNTRSNPNESESMWIPASAVAADGLSATGVIRGLKLSGLDYTTADSDNVAEFKTGDEVFCSITPQIGELLRSAIQGLIATGGSSFIIGTDASGTIDIKASSGTGTSRSFLRQTSAGVAQYYNGSSFVNFNDSIASVLTKVSAASTTPDYLYNLITSSDSSIVKAILNAGGAEVLDLTTALPARITSHAIYTPAYMLGGTSAETNTAIWDSVTNGSFRITLDGTAYNVDGISFSGITTMAQVASTIQTALRAACGSTPTVVWSTNRFIITSSNTTSSSAVSVLSTSTGTVGTDISGAGAGTYMDSETGRGTATAAVLDPTQDSGKIDLLDSNGQHKKEFLKYAVDQTTGYSAKGSMMAASAANTPTEVTVGANNTILMADSSQPSGVKWDNGGIFIPSYNIAFTLFNSPYTATVEQTAFSDATTKKITLSMKDGNGDCGVLGVNVASDIGYSLYNSDYALVSEGANTVSHGIWIGTDYFTRDNESASQCIAKNGSDVTISGTAPSTSDVILGHDPTNSYLLVKDSTTTIKRYSGISGTTLTFVSTITLANACDQSVGFVFDDTNDYYICADKTNNLIRVFNSSGTQVTTAAYTFDDTNLRGLCFIGSRLFAIIAKDAIGGTYANAVNFSFIPTTHTR